MDLQVVVDCWM